MVSTVLALGASGAGVVSVENIVFEPEFRKFCESNACGMYGKSWMCPPYVGTVEELIRQAKTYEQAIVYQIVEPLEDSYDIEGMLAAGRRMNDLTQKIRQHLNHTVTQPFLLLGAGGCRLCKRCAKLSELPCRFPDKALASLESYGIDVSSLAPLAGLRYIHGPNTVTYFGAIFLGKATP